MSQKDLKTTGCERDQALEREKTAEENSAEETMWEIETQRDREGEGTDSVHENCLWDKDSMKKITVWRNLSVHVCMNTGKSAYEEVVEKRKMKECKKEHVQEKRESFRNPMCEH